MAVETSTPEASRKGSNRTPGLTGPRKAEGQGDACVLIDGNDASKERNKREESDAGINDESIWNLRSSWRL